MILLKALATTLRVKGNTKSSFDVGFLNTIENRQKHSKQYKLLGQETTSSSFKTGKLLLKNVITKKKKLCFAEEFKENANKTLEDVKSFALSSEGGSQSKTTSKQNGGVNFDTKKNTNIS